MGSDVRISNAGNTADYFQGNDGSDVKLFHNGNLKLATTSGGIDVTGTVVCDGFNNSSSSFFQGPIDANDNTKIRLGTSQDLEMYFDGSKGVIDSTTANLDIQSSGAINIKPADSAGITAFNGGAVELYHNTNKRFSTTNSGFALKEGTTTRLSFEYSNSLAFITANAGNEIKVSSGNGDANGIEFWDYTGVNKRCQIDGHGIKFNADTAEANALDDYEEGTWSPAPDDGNNVFNYGQEHGRYTKIGNVIHVTYSFNASLPGSSGFAMFINLPFQVKDFSNPTNEGIGFSKGTGVEIQLEAQQGQSRMKLRSPSAGSALTPNNVGCTNNVTKEFRGAITYLTT